MLNLYAQEIPVSIDWSCMVASIMTGTAVLFELSALVVEYSRLGELKEFKGGLRSIVVIFNSQHAWKFNNKSCL